MSTNSDINKPLRKTLYNAKTAAIVVGTGTGMGALMGASFHTSGFMGMVGQCGAILLTFEAMKFARVIAEYRSLRRSYGPSRAKELLERKELPPTAKKSGYKAVFFGCLTAVVIATGVAVHNNPLVKQAPKAPPTSGMSH